MNSYEWVTTRESLLLDDSHVLAYENPVPTGRSMNMTLAVYNIPETRRSLHGINGDMMCVYAYMTFPK